MERRAAVIAASVISITAVSASGAMALAGGIFDDPSPPEAPEPIVAEAPGGTLPTTTVAPEVVTVFVDEPVAPATSPIAPTAPVPAPAAAAPANTRSAVFDDHGGDRPARGEHDSDDFDDFDDSDFDDSDFDDRDDDDDDADEDDD